MKNFVTALGIAFTFGLPYAAHAQTVVPPVVPPSLRVPSTSQAFLLGHGKGTQNYECQPSASTGHVGHVAWTLFTPQATLFNDLDEQLTTHFFSPNPDEDGRPVRVTWQDSRDTSTVWARAIASVVVTPNAVPWLLLQTVGTQEGPTGGTTLSQTTFIQRVNTRGGVAPATGCDDLPDVGHKAFVPYTADYFFFIN
jgi:Protein of unknown function (DUF3455)